MKAVIFSDIHLHNSKPFASILDNGINSRLQDEMNILQQIMDYCLKHKITNVFFCGDLFHNGDAISPDILSLLVDMLREWREVGLHIYAIPGQHDNLNAHFNGLDPLDDYIHLLPDGAGWKVRDLMVYSCYHRRGLENQRKALQKIQIKEGKKSIFIGHFLLKEILEATGVPYAKQGVEFSDLPVGMDFYFLGDYHPHLYIPSFKVMSVGSTHHHTWSSKNKPPGGFIVMDFDTGEFERVPLKAPMFVEVDLQDVGSFPQCYDKDNFYRVHVDGLWMRDEILQQLDDSWHVEFIFDNVEEEKEVSPDERPDIEFSMQPYEVITKYLQHKDRDPELAREGMKYVRRSA